MFSHGLRPRSQPAHHIVIIEFVAQHLDKKHTGLPTLFDRLRRKRNTALYDDSGFVSRHDAEEAITTARDYLAVVGANIDALRPKAGGAKFEPPVGELVTLRCSEFAARTRSAGTA